MNETYQTQTVDHAMNNGVIDVNQLPGAKSLLVTYLFWGFLGYVGAHRFYLRRYLSAWMMVALTIASGLLFFFSLGIIAISPIGIWLFIDLFLIPGMVRDYNAGLVITVHTVDGNQIIQ